MLQGKSARLRALRHEDLGHFVRWINEPDVRQFMAIRYPMSMTEEDQWWLSFLESKDNYIFAIEASDGNYIGNIGLHNVEWENRRAMLGIIIGDQAYWGQGYGTDAIRIMLTWTFEYLNMNRVYLTVYSYNERATACYKKCGFQHEGTMRQARYANGRYYDELMMGVLRSEFLQQQNQGT